MKDDTKQEIIQMKRVIEKAAAPFYSFIWERSTKNYFIQFYEFESNFEKIKSMKMSDDNNLLLIVGDQNLELWDLQTIHCKFTFDAESNINHCSFSQNETIICVSESKINILDINTGYLERMEISCWLG